LIDADGVGLEDTMVPGMPETTESLFNMKPDSGTELLAVDPDRPFRGYVAPNIQ
jgi:hypothetical protein